MKAARCDLGDSGWGDPWFPALSLVTSRTLQVAHGDFVVGLVVVYFYGPANMTHKLSSACAEMITSYHLSPQQTCFTHKLEPVTSQFCGFVVVFLLCGLFFCFGVVFAFGSLFFGFCSLERDKDFGLCICPLPVYFYGHYSFGPCVN